MAWGAYAPGSRLSTDVFSLEGSERGIRLGALPAFPESPRSSRGLIPTDFFLAKRGGSKGKIAHRGEKPIPAKPFLRMKLFAAR